MAASSPNYRDDEQADVGNTDPSLNELLDSVDTAIAGLSTTPARVGEQAGQVSEGNADATTEEQAKSSPLKEVISSIADTAKQTGQELGTTVKEQVTQLASDLQASAVAAASTAADSAKESAKARTQSAADEAALRAHLVKQVAADKLHGAADSVRQRSTLPEAEVINKVADRLDATAEYVREHAYDEMKGDFEGQVQESPLLAVALAFLVGFLLGTVLKRG